MPRILLLSSQPVLPGSIVKDLLEKGDADLAKIDIITNSGTLKPDLLAKDRYAAVFAFAEEAALHNLQFLSELQKSLASGGEVTIVERGHTDTKSLEKKLVIAGFIECKTEVSPSGDAMIEARKPAWSNPKGQSINLSGQRNGTSQLNRSTNGTLNTANTTAQPNQISALSAEDTGDDDLLDDDDLLLEEDKQRPSGYDCGVSTTKKACKNCTCGRADGEKVEVKLTQEMLENPQSGGCGSCGLGDAFRCGTCPYRGLPTFEMGKKIQLPSDFLTADI